MDILLSKGIEYLKNNDKVLRGIIKEQGGCNLVPSKTYFQNLVRSIISQQLSRLKEIPIPILVNNSQQDYIVKNVDQLLQLNKEIRETKLESNKIQIQTKIDYCENKIKEIVDQVEK